MPAPCLPPHRLKAKRGPIGDFKLVVMSATLEAAKFVSYLPGCKPAIIHGRTFPVQVGVLQGGGEGWLFPRIKLEARELRTFRAGQERQRRQRCTCTHNFPIIKKRGFFNYAQGRIKVTQPTDKWCIHAQQSLEGPVSWLDPTPGV